MLFPVLTSATALYNLFCFYYIFHGLYHIVPYIELFAMSNPWQASDTGGQTAAARQETLVDTFDVYKVVLFNDDVHTFDEVIFQIIKAIQCTRSKAEKHTWEVHTKGRSTIYAGTLPSCLKVSSILEEIDLKTEIQIG